MGLVGLWFWVWGAVVFRCFGLLAADLVVDGW